MQPLQSIGLAALGFLAYKFLYLPYSNKKKEESNEIERKISILSSVQKDMRKLFEPYANYQSYKSDDDDYHFEYGGWIKLYGRTLHFSSDNEIKNFKKKANELYQKLNSNETTKHEIELIIYEQGQWQEKENKRKEIAYLDLKRNFLEYDELLKELMPNSEVYFSKIDVVSFFEKKLSKSRAEGEMIFNNLTNETTGILSKVPFKGYGDKYCYYGEIALKTQIERL